MTIESLRASLSDRYRLDRELGQGGMATVYLAQDLKHGRKVAIKVVRPELSAVIGADRFIREITTIANLQHPHILGLIDSGEVGGTAYYVMPYVEGESLRDRLQREKQLPVPDAVRLATEVAGALDYAHRHGVIHRDIKPENILLHDGSALVADFGIALAASSAGTRMTETGMSLGTPQYMSPEQAMGEREITARSDIYALGAVTYEMLTGEPPFSGATAQAIVARVVTEQPRSLTAQRHTIPAHVEAAVLTALEKLPADRFASAGEFSAALNSSNYTLPMSATAARHVGSRSRFRDPVVIGSLLVALASVAGLLFALRRAPATTAATPVIRYIMPTTDSTIPTNNFPWPAAISPDGGMVVYSVGTSPSTLQLYLLRSDQLEAHVIPGTTGGYQPYFSPDGQWLAFEGGGKERKVRLDGSAPVTITNAEGANGATWTLGNEIILGNQGGLPGLSRVSVAGGTPVALTHVDSSKGERDHDWPVAMPDGKTVAFMIWSGSLGTARIALASLKDGAVTRLSIEGVRPLAMLDNMLVYVRADGVIMAVGVDLGAKRVTGTPIPVHDPVAVVAGFNGNSEVFIGSGGGLITTLGHNIGRVAWIDAAGHTTLISPQAQAVTQQVLSPNEQQVASVVRTEDKSDAWIRDLVLGTTMRLTTTGRVNSVDWSADGKQVIYTTTTDSGTAIMRQLAAGGSAAERLAEVPYPAVAAAISPDNKALLVSALTHDDWDVLRIALDSPKVHTPYFASKGNLHDETFSPDGKWVAITDDESGQDEVYVRSYPDPVNKLQVSSGGGGEAQWSKDGGRLYYKSGSTLLVARLDHANGLTLLGRDTVQTNLPAAQSGYFSPTFQVTRDGKRVLVSQPDRNSFQLVISPNWITEFRRKVKESGVR